MTMKRETWRETGPWANEPDEVDFEHEGYACRIRRMSQVGHLCGYVGLPEGHPGYGQDYDADIFQSVEAHGGLTFAGMQRPDAHWWIGFDCAHLGDSIPFSHARRNTRETGETYKDIAFVTAEIHRMIEGVKQLNKPAAEPTK